MAKLLFTLGVFLVVASIGTQALKLPKNVKVDVVTSKEMKDILKQYPNAVELPRKTLTPTATQEAKDVSQAAPNVLIEYFVGARVAGDFNVAHDHQSHSWATPQDIEMTLTYPASGQNGYIVSYVSIIVRQSNLGGRAYIIWGGIGYRYIRIVVEAYQTYIFDHDANFYGY